MSADTPIAGDRQGEKLPTERVAALWQSALQLYGKIIEHRVMLVAAGVTYYLLLALAPSLTVFVSIYGLFNDRTTVGDHVNLLIGIVPAGGLDIVRDQLTRLTTAPPAALSLTLAVSLLVALWSASAGINALFQAMNIAYELREKRNFFAISGLALLFTLTAVIVTILALSVVVVLPVVFAFFYVPSGYEWLITGAGYLVLLLVLIGGVGALYRWGPSGHEGRWRWITPGTILTIAATALISVLFSWYASSFGNYNAAYGSLGAIVGLMTWMWLTVIVLIVGAELNAEAERQRGEMAVVEAPEEPVHPPGVRRRDNIAAVAVILPAALLLALATRKKRPKA